MKPALSALLLLAACGPLPVDRAERLCLDSARLAERPRGEVGIGIGSDGRMRAGGSVTIASDWVLGRDPSDVFAACVLDRSGRMPTRPYTAVPR